MLVKNFTFSLTDRCSASCDICCFSCSPSRKNVLDKEVIKNYINQMAEIQSGTDETKTVSFTGGEAFVCYDTLKECMAYAKNLGLNSSVVTNGFWAKDESKTRKIFQELTNAGLTGMALSADIYHQKYVPIQCIKNILRVSKEFNVKIQIRIMKLKDDDSFHQTIEKLRPEIYGFQINTNPFYPVGNAAKLFPADKFIRNYKSETAICPFDKSIVAMFNGDILMCCSQFCYFLPILKIGKFGKTSIKKAVENISDNDFIYVMFSRGLGWYAKLAKNINFPVEDYYCAPCHLCYELFSNEEFIKQLKPYVEEEANRLRLQKLFSA